MNAASYLLAAGVTVDTLHNSIAYWYWTSRKRRIRKSRSATNSQNPQYQF